MPKTQVEIQTYYWKGQLRYKCPLKWPGSETPCEYDTYDQDQLKKHMVSDHKRPDGLNVEVKPQDLADQHQHHDDSPPNPEFEFVKFNDGSPEN
jgi:hypothetical protein